MSLHLAAQRKTRISWTGVTRHVGRRRGTIPRRTTIRRVRKSSACPRSPETETKDTSFPKTTGKKKTKRKMRLGCGDGMTNNKRRTSGTGEVFSFHEYGHRSYEQCILNEKLHNKKIKDAMSDFWPI